MQIQEIIDYDIFMEKLFLEVNHMTKISETAHPKKILPEVNALTTSMLAEVNI